MSVSMDMIVELLPLSSELQRGDNPLRIVLDRTVGEWLDNFSQPFEQLFLTSATGGWLDAHGRDYGVPRRLDEDDDSYRQRIVYEKLDHLTPSLLGDVYGVRLFSYREDFDVKDNTLVSDNPHIVMNESFLGLSDEDTISILDKKFILDSVVTWINSDGEIEYVLDTRGINILSNYSKIFTLTMLKYYFMGNATIMKVKLVLLNATNCISMFYNCSALTDVNLSLPNATSCDTMFSSCSNLVNVNLSLPKATSCPSMFRSCSNLVNINLRLPSVTSCPSMFYGCSKLVNVNLTLDNATDCRDLFYNCSNLVNIDLSLPKASGCEFMFDECSSLVNVKLNLPRLSGYESMLSNAPNIETIDVTIPTNKVSGFKSYVTGLNLENLTSFIINGEEQL